MAERDPDRWSAGRNVFARASPAGVLPAESPAAAPEPRELFPVMEGRGGAPKAAVGANPNGSDPEGTLRRLFEKHDIETTGPGNLLDKFLAPTDRGGAALSYKVNTPEKFHKLGVNKDKSYDLLSASLIAAFIIL